MRRAASFAMPPVAAHCTPGPQFVTPSTRSGNPLAGGASVASPCRQAHHRIRGGVLMRKFIALGAALAALAIAAATASAGGNPNTLTLAVYGDSPYWDTTPAFVALRTAEFDRTPAFINTINADP